MPTPIAKHTAFLTDVLDAAHLLDLPTPTDIGASNAGIYVQLLHREDLEPWSTYLEAVAAEREYDGQTFDVLQAELFGVPIVVAAGALKVGAR